MIIDALVDMGILKNDGWGCVGDITERHQLAEPGYPGVMVILEDSSNIQA